MTYSPPNGTIDFEIKDSVAWIALNQPETHNTIDGRMQVDLEGLWAEINMNDDIRVAVVTGNGRDFSDGLDVEPDPRASTGRLDWLGTFAHQPSDDLTNLGIGPMADAPGLFQIGLPDRPRGRPAKPLIVAINGACSGVALSFVMFADIVIAADDAAFFDRRVNVGDAPLEETVGLVKFGSLPRLIALRLACQGINFKLTAEHAYQLGMVTEVVPAGQLRDRAGELAQFVAQASPAAVRAIVAAYWDSVNMPYGQAALVAPLFGQQARQMDGKEGYLAAVEGREPQWPSATSWSPPWTPFRLPAQ